MSLPETPLQDIFIPSLSRGSIRANYTISYTNTNTHTHTHKHTHTQTHTHTHTNTHTHTQTIQLAYYNISPYRNTSASLLTNELTNVEKWDNDNLVKFNEEKTTQVVISRKHHQDFTPVFMNGHKLDISSSFTPLGLSI